MENTEKKSISITPGTVLLGLTLAAALITGVALSVSQRRFGEGAVAIDGGPTVRVAVASTRETRERGLSGHDPLGPLEGMLFTFPKADRYAFWMKDMLFPIDIIWINGNEIMDITTEVPLSKPGEEIPRYFPKFPVDKALEVKSGFSREHGLKAGTMVRIDVDKK